jgi:hypothetical protein
MEANKMTDKELMDPRRCQAHSKRTLEQCGRYPAPGFTTCRWHGAAAPQVKNAAKQRVIIQEVREDAGAILAHEGIESMGDPLDELGKLASASQAMMEALGARVNYLKDVATMSADGKETIRVEVVLYERAIDRTAKLLEILVRAGFMERQVKIQEGTGEAVAMVLRRIFTRLGLDERQQTLIATVVPEELRALEM